MILIELVAVLIDEAAVGEAAVGELAGEENAVVVNLFLSSPGNFKA